jgi:hypothetical protein
MRMGRDARPDQRRLAAHQAMERLRRLVAVATITRVSSIEEEALLCRSLDLLAGWGTSILVADAGTCPTFTQLLQGSTAFNCTLPIDTGLIAQVKASVCLAANAWDTVHPVHGTGQGALFQARHSRARASSGGSTRGRCNTRVEIGHKSQDVSAHAPAHRRIH